MAGPDMSVLLSGIYFGSVTLAVLAIAAVLAVVAMSHLGVRQVLSMLSGEYAAGLKKEAAFKHRYERENDYRNYVAMRKRAKRDASTRDRDLARWRAGGF